MIQWLVVFLSKPNSMKALIMMMIQNKNIKASIKIMMMMMLKMMMIMMTVMMMRQDVVCLSKHNPMKANSVQTQPI